MARPGRSRVIFIGGTAYSGSTLFDMILANDPAGFSCGEVNSLVYPFRSHHLSPVCGCGASDCPVWESARATQRQGIHEAVFQTQPEVGFLVDSSKSIAWIESRLRRLRKANIDASIALIWKSPAEYFASRRKRGQVQGWADSWIKYHRLFLSLFQPDLVVAYADLVRSPATLRLVCDALELPYRNDKHEYWQKRHHTLFGNSSAKIHLYSEQSNQYERMESELRSMADEPNRHRALYYQSIEGIPGATPERSRILLERLTAELSSLSVGRDTAPDYEPVRYSPIARHGQLAFYRTRQRLGPIALKMGLSL